MRLQLRSMTYPMRAVEMCAAGIRLTGQVPAAIGDKVQLTIAFPGRPDPLAAHGTVVRVSGGEIGCEYWAADSYEQQFLEQFVQACARRQALRNQASTHHP